jgi:hypothetical protein
MTGIATGGMGPGIDQPRVGIFWLLDDSRLIFETSLLSVAEKYGDCVTHPRSHIDVWTELQMGGQVAADVEYEAYPRGRVVYDTRIDCFVIMADRCILSRKELMRRIRASMDLTGRRTEASADSHYRCSRCLYKTPKENDDEP